jgi:transposase
MWKLTGRVSDLLAVLAEQAALVETLRAEVAALRRQAGRDSSNSSQPPSQDGPAAGAKKKVGQREARRARPGRPQGGRSFSASSQGCWTYSERVDAARAAV